MSEEWRELIPRDRAIIDRLLEPDFEGRDEIRAQLEGCLVRRWPGDEEAGCNCGSVEFQVSSDVLIPGSRPVDTLVPVEGRAIDDDNVVIEVLLFHKDGRLKELEYVMYSDSIKRHPNAGDLTIHIRDR